MTAKKIDKEYLLTDDSINVYGFRLLTSGYLMDRYQKNPIGYRMHKREDGVVLRWEDLRVDGDKVYGKPVINLSNPLGKQTADEVENGFLNAASIGGIVVLEYSDDKSLMLPGQSGPTVTKWYNKETSLVDVPGNPNATVQLFDADDHEINLTDFIQQTLKKRPNDLGLFHQNKNKEMALKTAIITALALADNTTDDAISKHIQDLADTAAKVPGLEKDLATAKTDKEKAEKDLADFVANENATKIKAITDKGLADGKLTAKSAKELGEKYADNPAGLQNLIADLPAYKTATSDIKDGKADVKALADMSWEELDRKGKLPDLKAADLEIFKNKYKAKFGKEYQD